MMGYSIRHAVSAAVVQLSVALLMMVASASAQAPVWSVQNGVVNRNGVPFFPKGFYYVSWYDSEEARRLQDLNKIAQAGFNFMATPIDMKDKAFMDAAASLGVYVNAENNDPNGAAKLIAYFKGHPALAAVQAVDDADRLVNGVPLYTPTQVKNKCDALTALSPNIMSYISGGSRIGGYVGTADMIGFQTYPIDYEPLGSITTSYYPKVINSFRTAKQPLIANLQTFGWHGTHRYPTPAEVRNMTYQALLQGVQGILYYAYYDRYTDLNTQPALWTEMRKISSELKTLESFLLKGLRTSISTGKTEAYAAKWKLGKTVIVAVVNNSTTSSKSVALPLNEDLNGTVSNLFAGRTGRMTLSGKTLSGTLPMRDVQVYKLGLR